MKAKLKSANKFTRFMLAHGEKLGMAAVAAVAGLLIWSSLGRPHLEANKQPPDLIQEAVRADAHVQEMSWESFPEPDRTIAEKFQVSIDPNAPVVNPDDPWQIDKFDPPTYKPVSKRLDPDLLTVQKPEVSADSGIWISGDPEAIKRMKDRALEEFEKQQARERKAREDAQRMRDEDDDGGGRRRRGGGRDGGYGGEFGRGGAYGGMGGESMTKDGVMVLRPAGGAPLQGGEDIRNESWVIVKGIVPIRTQSRKYDDALRNALGYDPATDVPAYKGYEVQRCEVTEDGQTEWETIHRVGPPTLAGTLKYWPIVDKTGDDHLLNPKAKHPLLTFPLPPMALRAWDSSVTHSEIQPLTPEEMMMEMAPPGERRRDRDKDDEDEGETDPFASERPRGPGAMGGEYGRGAYPGGMDGSYGRPDMGRPGGGYGMERGGEFGRGGGMGMGRDGGYGRGGGYGGGFSVDMLGGGSSIDPAEFEMYSWDGSTRNLLFRYFDVNRSGAGHRVEPGKQYRYRVRLALVDVNAYTQAMYLADEVTARREKEAKPNGDPLGYRFSDWSEPSPVATVPHTGLVYVAGAEPANPTNLASEPEAKILIKTLDAGQAAEVALAENFLRGTVLNLFDQTAQIIWSATFQPMDPDGAPKESPKFSFRTGLTLLDFDGGEVLGGNRDLKAPARALIMDAAGKMRIESELDKYKTVWEYDKLMEMKTQAERAARQREDDGGRRGGRGGRD